MSARQCCATHSDRLATHVRCSCRPRITLLRDIPVTNTRITCNVFSIRCETGRQSDQLDQACAHPRGEEAAQPCRRDQDGIRLHSSLVPPSRECTISFHVEACKPFISQLLRKLAQSGSVESEQAMMSFAPNISRYLFQNLIPSICCISFSRI